MPAQTLAILTFLSPAWALGLFAAVGLPVLAHLLSRTRYRPVDFPGTRFVAQAVLQAQQINRPRHWLLLLLRMLALAAVVAAFMQPSWERAAAATPGQRGTCLVLIVDGSASMQRAERGESLFSQARKIALDQLDALNPQHDRAVVILADASPSTLLSEPSGNLTLLRDRLSEAECTFESTDLDAAVALADAVLAEQQRAGRVVVISDGQATNRSGEPLQATRSGTAVTDLRVGEEPSGNVSVRLLDASPYPPVGGLGFEVTVELRNGGASAAEVALRGEGGAAPVGREVTLAPGAVATQTLTFVPKPLAEGEVAVFEVGFELADGFVYDNTTGLVTPVMQSREVQLVTEGLVSEGTTAGRIALALSPPRRDAGGPSTIDSVAAPVRVVRRSPSEVSGSASEFGETPGCWVVSGLDAAVMDAFLANMQRHLRAGGGVVWILDSQPARDALSALPCSPLVPTSLPAGEAIIASAQFDHPVLAVFEGPSRASLVGATLQGVAEAQVGDGTAVLLRSSDGRPILAAQSVGRGRLVVFNADLSPAVSDFASQPGFVPLVNELVRFAVPGLAMPAPHRPGDPWPAALAEANAKIQKPVSGNTPPRIGCFETPGAYLRVSDDSEPLAGAWAELDPAESDFRAAPGPAREGDSASSASTPAIGAAPRRAVELWPFLIACGLLLVGSESLLLLAFARRGGGA